MEFFTDLIESLRGSFERTFIVDSRWKYLLDGLLVTLRITFFAVLIGIVIGIVVAVVRTTYDNNRESLKRRGGFGYFLLSLGNGICKLYLSVYRGTPVVVQLLITYFVIFASSTDDVGSAIFAFGINSGAYLAEVMRSGIMSIDRGQMEAGRSLGFNYAQTMLRIVLPQALKNMLPALLNEFIALLKETSIAGYIGVRDLTKAGDQIRGVSFEIFMPLIAVALIYLCIVLLLTFLVGKLERRLRRSEH